MFILLILKVIQGVYPSGFIAYGAPFHQKVFFGYFSSYHQCQNNISAFFTRRFAQIQCICSYVDCFQNSFMADFPEKLNFEKLRRREPNSQNFCTLLWKNLERFTNLRVILAQGPC